MSSPKSIGCAVGAINLTRSAEGHWAKRPAKGSSARAARGGGGREISGRKWAKTAIINLHPTPPLMRSMR
jgi:hypothetical protein